MADESTPGELIDAIKQSLDKLAARENAGAEVPWLNEWYEQLQRQLGED